MIRKDLEMPEEKKTKAKATSKKKKAAAKPAGSGEPYSTPAGKRTPGVKIWSPEEASAALAAAKDSPEVGDAFTPTPGDGPGKKLGPPLPRKKPQTLEEQAEARGKEVEAEQRAAALAIREGKTVGPPMPRARALPKAEAEQPTTDVEILYEPEEESPQEQGPAMVEDKKLVAALDKTVATAGIMTAIWRRLNFSLQEGKDLTAFYQKRERVTLELQDGTFTMPAMAAVKNKYSITLLLPLDTNGVAFVPRPGTQLEMRLEGPGDGEKVYFPGAYCEIAPLKLAAMTFIREQEDAGEA